MKVNITLNDELLARVDEFAKENYMTRSGLTSVALTQYLAQQECIEVVKRVALLMEKMADKENCSQEDLARLETYEQFLELYLSSVR